jgi:hypothetical protein
MTSHEHPEEVLPAQIRLMGAEPPQPGRKLPQSGLPLLGRFDIAMDDLGIVRAPNIVSMDSRMVSADSSRRDRPGVDYRGENHPHGHEEDPERNETTFTTGPRGWRSLPSIRPSRRPKGHGVQTSHLSL